MPNTKSRIFRLYFAIVALLTFFAVVGSVESMLKIGLKTFVITAADAPTSITVCDASVSTKTKTIEELNQECETKNATAIQKYRQQKATEVNDDIALLIVMLPLFALHFSVFYREWKKSEKTA